MAKKSKDVTGPQGKPKKKKKKKAAKKR